MLESIDCKCPSHHSSTSGQKEIQKENAASQTLERPTPQAGSSESWGAASLLPILLTGDTSKSLSLDSIVLGVTSCRLVAVWRCDHCHAAKEIRAYPEHLPGSERWS
ncbi:hypothetical protein HBH56_230550 [Parastagonospora nodorum]|uniref:Uncharacterized protein n=1 Tax=Phaeosphaeria nodorum (strain SN15 / ATCC MYA-4574 / FGSC 10173) TaxID=321614 RepID=A0A7U2I126_PHANO|nr:hypothetical protein HBH56_230550 [Parastagonospora nodorum]QRC99420.1 hypothetical protein JI435_436970 [Parastagonospora nodorum SN15]KAH3924444.1 hypothetical protein HBH54_194620 [Parastagonospora nodorum]KAH3958388.1 hypothetical protein HBH51_210270 [Parastagonospora nodorum]KAH3993687.1 hypothetical protein HBI10_198940 [Parastagonospora nodorum]